MTEERIGAAMPGDDPGEATDEPSGDAPDVNPGDESPADGGADVESLRAELEQMRSQFLRARADYQNLERRAQEERREFGRYQATALVLNFLPVLDDLQRALETSPDPESVAAWAEGVQLVEQKFRGVLEAAGVTEIEAMGVPFDPELHEAVASAPGPEGQVISVTRKGYMMQERVIRPATVVVGSGDEAGA